MESLELGPPPAAPGRRKRLIVAVVVVVLGLMIAVGIHNSRPEASAPAPTEPVRSKAPPSPTPRSLPTPSAGADVSLSPPDVERRPTDGFLSDVDLDLFARSDSYLYRIQTKKRLITTTKTPDLQSGGSLTFVTGRRQVIVRDYGDGGAGYVVPDGKPAQPLPRRLKSADEIYPGPSDRLWVTTHRGRTSTTQLTDLRGRPVRDTRGSSQFENLGSLQPDGFGGVLVASAGGYYELTPKGPRRVTRGLVLATGRSHLLTADCNSTLECSRYLVDRTSGEQRRLGTVPANSYADGTVSDDGRYAALWTWGRNGGGRLRVVDLRTDKTITQHSDAEWMGDSGSLIWLPDNRLVGIQNGEIFVFSPKTGRFTTPDLKIYSLQQLSRRTS